MNSPTVPLAHAHATSQRPIPARRLPSPLLRGLLVAAAAIPAVVSQAAVIKGTVIHENTQKYLERAAVAINGTTYAALTQPDGSFRISGVPAGTYTLTAEYTGLGTVSKTITVTEDETLSLDLALTADVYVLEPFAVSGTREGLAFALTQQRRSETSRSVTSIDSFADQATGNPGEFLKNVEGIQMDYSQNEPQTIRVRGFDPNLTTVTMDGNEIASAASSSASRAVQIDQLSLASIESVEVYKSPIPSMSANAIGGAVNFITKSAFQQKGQRIKGQVGVNMESHDFHFRKSPGPGHGEKAERRVYPAGKIEYSNSFFDNRLGIMASAGIDNTNQLGSSTSHELAAPTALPPATALPAAPTEFTQDNAVIRRANFSMAPNRQLRDRWDVSLNIDGKLTESIVLFLKTTYSDYHSTNRNHGFTLAPGTTLVAGSTLEAYTTANGTASQGVSVFDKYTKSWQLSPGLNFKSGDWKAELIGGFSKSTNHYENPDNFGAISVRLPSVGWSMATPTDTDVPTAIVQNSGPDFYNLNNYAPNQGSLVATNGVQLASHGGLVENNKRDSANTKYSGRFDLQRSFNARFPFYLKAGLAYNENIWDKNQARRRWYWMGDDGIATADDFTAAGAQLGRFAEPVPVTQGIPGWSLREPTYFSTHELWNYWQANPQVLQENLAYALQQKIIGRQKVNEKVRGYYVMGNVTINKLNILAGMRLEETDLTVRGYKVLPHATPSVLPPGLLARDYVNTVEGTLLAYRPTVGGSGYRSLPFKYLHLRYEILEGLQARASYADAIGRPNLSDLIPSGQSQDDSTDVVTANNRAGLLPQRSQNLDFSLEYYTRTNSQFTFGVFSRDVEDYISTATMPLSAELMAELNLDPATYAGYQVRTKTNLGYAKWSGFEFKFSQSLRDFESLPKFLQGFSFWGNYTKIAKMEGDYGTPGTTITKLANVVPELINAGVKYRTPRGKFEIGLSTNYQAAKPTANMPGNQRAPSQEAYQFWNLDATYRLTDRIRLVAVGRNIFSERPVYSDMRVIRNTQQATGVAWMFATKFDY